MVDPGRLELPTSCVSSKRSNQLSYGSKLSIDLARCLVQYQCFQRFSENSATVSRLTRP